MPLDDTVTNQIQSSLSRIDAAAAIARSLLRVREDRAAEDIPDGALERAADNARRCLELYLSARRITGICRRSLGINFPGQPPSAGEANRAPPLSESICQAEQAAADGEKVSADLIAQLSTVVVGNDGMFAGCITDLLAWLMPMDEEGWQLISATARKREPYKWIVADQRIQADV